MKRDLLEHNMNEKDAIFFSPRNRIDHGAWLIPIQQKPILEEDTPKGRSGNTANHEENCKNQQSNCNSVGVI